MSQVIENRILEMSLDTTDLEPNAKQAINIINELKDSLKFEDAAQNLTYLNTAASKVDISAAADNIESVSDKILGKLSTLRLSVASALGNIFSGLTKDLIIDPIAQSISGGIARSQNIADAKFQLEGLGVAWERIKQDIDYAVDGTAYGLDVAAKAASQLSASGVEMGNTMKAALRGISGVAAMGATEYEAVSPIFTKAAGQGRVMADELNRISQFGLNASAELAKFFNTIESNDHVTEDLKKQVLDVTGGLKVTESDIREFASKSKINFEMFAYAMDDAFGQHAKDANKTFTGAMSNMKAALNRIGEQFRAPIMDASIDVFNALRLMINQIKANLQPIIDVWTRLAYFAGSTLSTVVNKVTDMMKAFTGAQNISNGFLNILYSISIVVKTIANAFKQAFGKGGADSPINGLNKAAESFEKFTQKLVPTTEGLRVLGLVFKTIFSVVKMSVDGILLGFSTLIKIVKPVASVLAYPFLYLISAIQKAIQIIDKLTKGTKSVGEFFTRLKNEILQAFPGLNNFIELLKQFSPYLEKAGDFIKKFGITILSVIGGPVVLAIATLVTAFQKLKTLSLADVINNIKGLVDKVKSFPEVSKAIENIKFGIEKLKSALSNAWDAIVNFFGKFRKESDETSRSVTKDMSGITKVINGLKIVFAGLGGLLGGAVVGGLKLFNKAFEVIRNFKMQSVIDGIKTFIAEVKEFGLLTTISNKLKTSGSIISDVLLKVIDKIKEFFKEMKESDSIIDFFIGKIHLLIEKLSELKDKVEESLFGKDISRSSSDNAFSKVIDAIKEKFAGLIEYAKQGFAWLRDNGALTKTLMIGYTLAILKALISFSKNSTKITDAMVEGKGFFGMFTGINNVLNSTSGLLNRIANPFEKLGEAIEKWGKAQKKSGAEQFAIVIKSMAVAIGVMAASLALLYAVVGDDMDKFKEIAKIVGIFFGAMMAIAAGMTILAAVKKVDQSFFSSFAANMIAMAICIAAMGLVINAFSKIDPAPLWIAVGALTAVLLVYTLVQFILSKIGVAGITIVGQIKGMVKIAGKIAIAASALILIAAGLAAMAGALMLVKKLGLASQEGAIDDLIFGLIMIGGIFATIIIVSMGCVGATAGILQISAALALLGIAAINLVIVSLLMKAVQWESLAKAGAALLGLAGLMFILAKFAGGSEAIKGILSLSAALVLLTLALGNIALMAVLMKNIPNDAFKKPMQILAGLTGLLALLILAAGSVDSETGLKSLVAIVAGMILLMGSLIILSVMCGNDKIFQDILKASSILVVIMGMWALVLAAAGTIKTGQSWKPILVAILGMGLIFGAMFALAYQVKDPKIFDKLVGVTIVVAGVMIALMQCLKDFLGFAKEINAGQGKFVTKAMVAFGVMIAAFVILAATLGIVASKTNGYEVAAMALTIGAAVVGLAFAAKIMIAACKGVKWDQLIKTAAALGIMVAAIAVLSIIFALISNAMNNNQTRALGGSDSPIVAMLAMVGMLFLLSLAFKQLGSMSLKEIGKATLALAAMSAIMVIVGAVLYVLGQLPLESGILAKSQVIMLVLAELTVLTALLSVFGVTAAQALPAIGVLAGLGLIFLALGALLTIMGLMPIDTSILAKSQIVMLVLAELVALTVVLGMFALQGTLAIASLPALLGLSLIFIALGGLLTIMGLMPIDTSILAKSQIVMLVLAELTLLLVALGAIAVLGLLALASIPALLGLTVVFGVLALVATKLAEVELEGLGAKMDVLTSVLWKMVGVIAVLGLLSLGAIGQLAGAAAILMVAQALVPLTQALQNMEGLDLDRLSQGLKLLAAGLGLLVAAGILGVVAAVGFIVMAAGIAAIGAACLLAGVGITAFTTSLMLLGTMISMALHGIVEAAAAIVEGFKEKLSEILTFIDDLINAIVEKVSAPVNALKNAGTNMGNAIVNAFRNATGWHSPPEFIVKFFKDAGVAVNENADGVTDLFDGTGNDWGSALTEALGNKISDFDIGSLGDKLGSLFGDGLFNGAYPGISNITKLLEGLGFVTSKTYYSQSKLLDMMRKGQISSTEFNQRMKDLNSTSKDTTGILDGLADAFKKTGKNAKGAGKEVKSFTDTLTDTLTNQLNIFSKFEAKNPMNKTELLNNMKSQIKGMTDWAGQMNKLATMGIDQGLYKKLAEMGPQGAEYVGAFTQMTAEELAQANELWAQSLTLPGDLAKQLGVNVENIGLNVGAGLSKGINESVEGVKESSEGMAQDGIIKPLETEMGINSPSKVAQNWGFWIDLGLAWGITNNQHFAINAMIMMCNLMVDKARKLLDPEMVFKPIGAGVVEGLVMGLEDPDMLEKLEGAIETIADMVEEVARSAKGFDVNSPSKRMIPIGMGIGEGLEVGINRSASGVVSSIEDLSDSAISAMKYTVANIASMINNEIEDPVIRPILDLSNVQAGARSLNSIFSLNRSIASASQLGALQNGQYSANGNVVFNQYNNSPKALSRIEIYRDTRNLISQYRNAQMG